jgi:hypothetical protein
LLWSSVVSTRFALHSLNFCFFIKVTVQKKNRKLKKLIFELKLLVKLIADSFHEKFKIKKNKLKFMTERENERKL